MLTSLFLMAGCVTSQVKEDGPKTAVANTDTVAAKQPTKEPPAQHPAFEGAAAGSKSQEPEPAIVEPQRQDDEPQSVARSQSTTSEQSYVSPGTETAPEADPAVTPSAEPAMTTIGETQVAIVDTTKSDPLSETEPDELPTTKTTVQPEKPSGDQIQEPRARSTVTPEPSLSSESESREPHAPSSPRAMPQTGPLMGISKEAGPTDVVTSDTLAAKQAAKELPTKPPALEGTAAGSMSQALLEPAIVEPQRQDEEPQRPARSQSTALGQSNASPGTATAPEVDPAVPPATEPAIITTGETQVAMVDPTTSSPLSETEPMALVYDEEHLPISFPGGWVLDIGSDERDGATRCLVLSPPVAIFDGYEPSQIKLQITQDAVLVEANSNIDISYPSLGLSVDGTQTVPFEAELLSKRVIYTLQPVQTAMAGGEQLTVSLGFWPSWPVTETQRTSLTLNGFKQAYAALQRCEVEH
jgi:hypothetical protein